MAVSVAGDVAAEVLSILGGLGLTVGSDDVTVKEGKLPVVDGALDVLPVLIFCPPDEADDDAEFDTGTDRPRRLHSYFFDVILVAKGNRDVQTALPDYRQAREKISFRFGTARPLATAGVLTVQVIPRLMIDRALVSADYDYSGMRLRVDVVVTP